MKKRLNTSKTIQKQSKTSEKHGRVSPHLDTFRQELAQPLAPELRSQGDEDLLPPLGVEALGSRLELFLRSFKWLKIA